MKNKRSIAAAILMFVFMLSLCGTAYASSYKTTVKFKNPYSGVCRSYDGNNIRYSATMKSSKANDSGTYVVVLERGSGVWAFEVGRKTLKRVGYGKAEWSNVGKGEYRVSFEKSNDGVILSSNNVCIENY